MGSPEYTKSSEMLGRGPVPVWKLMWLGAWMRMGYGNFGFAAELAGKSKVLLVLFLPCLTDAGKNFILFFTPKSYPALYT